VRLVVKNGRAYTLDELARRGRFSNGRVTAEPHDMEP
jgi:hypothetical protein